MFNALKPEMLKRYKNLAALLWKYGRDDWFQHAGMQELLQLSAAEDEEEVASSKPEPGDIASDTDEQADSLSDDLEALGPTYVKLGQMLASRADLLPPRYLRGLSRLQDHVEPFPYEDASRIFEEETGVDPARAFAAFSREPIAAASLGQVHRGTTHTGDSIVVKIQRPDIREQVAFDLEAIRNVAELLDKHVDAARRYQVLDIVDQFESAIVEEMDYTKEADNLRTIGHNLKDFDDIVVPQPIDQFTRSRVLTMTFLEARRVDELTERELTGEEGERLAGRLFHAYLKQILQDGFFHADPHAGNVLVTSDRKIAMLDLGMVGRLNPNMRERLLNLLLAVSEGRSEDVAAIAAKLGDPTDKFDPAELRRQVDKVVLLTQPGSVKKIQVGQIVMSVCHAAAEAGLRMPPRVSLLGKTMVNLDEVGRALAPDFDPNAAIRKHAQSMVRNQMKEGLTPSALMQQALELKDFTQKVPGRVGQVLDALAEGNLRVNVDAVDEDRLISGLQKIANRVTVGLVIAAMIIGAAMLMNIESKFTIFGYPGLAIILFVFASVIGSILIFRVMWADRE